MAWGTHGGSVRVGRTVVRAAAHSGAPQMKAGEGRSQAGSDGMAWPVASRPCARHPAASASSSAPMRGLRAFADATAACSTRAPAGGLIPPTAVRRAASCATSRSSGTTHWYTGQGKWPRAAATAAGGAAGHRVRAGGEAQLGW